MDIQPEARMTEEAVAGTIKPAEEKVERQATLFPKKPKPPKPEETDVWLKVEDLPSTEGIDPGVPFIENVKYNGIFFTIALRRTKRGLSIVDGRRRLETARRLGLEEVRCDIYPISAKVQAIMTLVANYQRSNNPPSELEAIERLLKRKGVPPQLISEQLGVPIQTIEKRLKLKALVSELRAAFDAYKIAVTVAEAASRLETARQMDLVAILQDKGKLTMADVNAALQVKAKEATDSLPDSMFKDDEKATNDDIVKVERDDVEKAAEIMGYAVDALKTLANKAHAADQGWDYGPLVQDLEQLARKFRIMAAD
jgi:ParB-like chromosome segregation protein Spo0J